MTSPGAGGTTLPLERSLHFQIITLFPERYHHYLESGLPSKAASRGLFKLSPTNLREFAGPGRGGRVDDAPYGGGPGMVLEVGPIDAALASLPEKLPVVLLTPRGERLQQARVREFADLPGLTVVCGYYEGVDERVAEHLVDHQISLGDFILGSGDLAALCLIEAVTRLLPGYMGCADSSRVESNEGCGALEYPQYTRPASYRGWDVPEVLLSGNHGEIERWRQTKSLEITRKRRHGNGSKAQEPR